MSFLSGFFTWLLIWWIVLFMALPFKVKLPDETQPGFATSAPTHPHLKGKLFITTLISLVVWGIVQGMLTFISQENSFPHILSRLA